MSSNRTANSIKNIQASILNKLVIMGISFISRRYFVQFIGTEYLGVNSLFTEIIGILSMADLGLATAMTYSFYKPIAENDREKIAALVNFYKKVYTYIAVAVAAIGLCIMPFLRFIVKTDADIKWLELYYIVFLMNTVVSYLFVYKSAVITASQKQYIVLKYQMWINVIRDLLHIVVVVTTRSFLLYLIVSVISTVANNLLISKRATELYPEISLKGELDGSEKKDIFSNLKSMFLYKLSSTLLTSTDNILISVICGTLFVGLYANYKIVITNLNMFVSLFFNSLTASIGNLIIMEEAKLRYKVFKSMQMVSFFLSAVISCCIFILMDDFILIWLESSEFVLNRFTLISILLNLYIAITLQPLWSYREATGLYQRTKYVMVAAAVVNLVLSIILGIEFGIGGIILASFIAKVSTYVWFEPKILFKEYFQVSSLHYLRDHIINGVLTVFCIGMATLCTSIFTGVSIVNWLCKAVISGVIVVIVYFFRYYWTEEMKYLKDKFLGRRKKAVTKED